MTGQFPHYSDYQPQPGPQQPHPSLGLGVTAEERDRAEQFLADAYADGRVNEIDFDRRMDQVLQAQSRKDLNQAFYGLVDVPPTSRALGLHPAYRPDLVRQGADSSTGKGVAALAHLSPVFTGVLGPLIINLVAKPGSFAKREAAKAFNFQFTSLVLLIVAGVLTGVVGDSFSWLLGLGWVAWFALTIIGGVKAAQGEDWQNPVRKVIPLTLLKEK